MDEAPADLAVIGYFATVKRLMLPCALADVGGGKAGVLLAPTLTADAALVGLELAGRGWSVAAHLSHPGPGRDERAAIALLEQRIGRLTLGPDRGAPMEIQLLHVDKEVVWHNDPIPGLQSLAELGVVVPVTRTLYLDLFDWLEPLIAVDLAHQPALVLLNGGRRPLASLAALIGRWRPRIEGRLALQISAPGIADPDELVAVADLIVEAGADLAVVTASAYGLAIATRGAPAVHRPARDEPILDASGAGAAVSAALIAALDLQPDAAPAALAEAALDAGAARCGIDGAVDPASAARWQLFRDIGGME